MSGSIVRNISRARRRTSGSGSLSNRISAGTAGFDSEPRCPNTTAADPGSPHPYLEKYFDKHQDGQLLAASEGHGKCSAEPDPRIRVAKPLLKDGHRYEDPIAAKAPAAMCQTLSSLSRSNAAGAATAGFASAAPRRAAPAGPGSPCPAAMRSGRERRRHRSCPVPWPQLPARRRCRRPAIPPGAGMAASLAWDRSLQSRSSRPPEDILSVVSEALPQAQGTADGPISPRATRASRWTPRSLSMSNSTTRMAAFTPGPIAFNASLTFH